MSISGEEGNDLAGETDISQELLRDFRDAVSLLEPQLEYIAPGIFHREFPLEDVNNVEVMIFDKSKLEESVAGSTELMYEPQTRHGLILNELSTNEDGKKVLIKRRYNVATYVGSSGSEHLEPSESEEYFVEDENGNMVAQVSPAIIANERAKRLALEGNKEAAEIAKREFYDLINQQIELETMTGTARAQQTAYLRFMSIVQGILDEQGISGR